MKAASTILGTSFFVALVATSFDSTFAATSAYWRHEEGPAGSIVPDGPATVLDSSGNGNHMETFSSGFSPFTAATYSPIVSPLPLRSGLPNTLSLDFGPNPTVGTEDGADPNNGNGLNDDNYSQGAAINSQLFGGLTVELSFRMHTIGGFQALVGKDGKPLGDAPGEDDRPVPPLKIMVRGDNFPEAISNQLFVEWVDGDGTLATDIHFLAGGETIVPDQWYHVAFTLDATNASLWVAKEAGAYELRDNIAGGDFAHESGHVLVEDPTNWSIGRGMFNNGVADWSNAIIDEVRVSDTALTPDQFLFLADDPDQAGDLDGDGDVDGNDFLEFQRGVPTFGTAELDDIKNNFGAGPAVAAAGAVPEPSTVLLAAAAMLGLAARRRRSY